MGLPTALLQMLAQHHHHTPFTDPVLILGRQDVHASLATAIAICSNAGIVPAMLPHGYDTRSLVPGRQDNGEISDETFFRLLGLTDIKAMDYSDYESAQIIADLNLPVDPALHNRFGTIIDSGTTEHIFDVRTCMMNVAQMLRPGGQVVHIAPGNQYLNHGFIQVSPTMYQDYYTANAFTDVGGFLLFHPRIDPYTRPWHAIKYDHRVHGGQQPFFLGDDLQLNVYFTATKTAQSTAGVIPIQSFWTRMYHGENTQQQRYILRYSPERLDFAPA